VSPFNVLLEHIDDLLRRFTGGPGQPPRPSSVVVVEITQRHFDEDGRPHLSQAELVLPDDFEARFAELLAAGFSWLNLSYCGELRGRGVIMVETPSTTRRSASEMRPSINFSGPPRRVAEANWDAARHIVIDQ